MIKTLAAAAVLSLGLAGYAIAQEPAPRPPDGGSSTIITIIIIITTIITSPLHHMAPLPRLPAQ